MSKFTVGLPHFDPYTIEIGKGTQSGIRDGMAVVSVGGLIGRIEDPDQGAQGCAHYRPQCKYWSSGSLNKCNEVGIRRRGGVGKR